MRIDGSAQLFGELHQMYFPAQSKTRSVFHDVVSMWMLTIYSNCYHFISFTIYINTKNNFAAFTLVKIFFFSAIQSKIPDTNRIFHTEFEYVSCFYPLPLDFWATYID